MRLYKLIFVIPLLLIISSQNIYGFGKNKVIYKNFSWYYIQSKHFDVYFYEGGKEIAEFTAEIAETAYVQLKRDFRFDIKERIVFIVYNSHNDWQQTNVVISYLEEGIGGVTELYKNRIVVPFEGSYEQFRHVIHHELVHAVTNDMLYGGSIQSLIVGEVIQAPLWFSEGLAEFQSTGWDTRLDMVVRDAVLNGYIPDLQNLQYYLVYQGGASVFRYIASTYGRKKIGEILHKMRGKVTFEKVLRSSVGIGYQEFTQKWHRYLRKHYWPDVSDRKEPAEISKQLTHHNKIPNFLNVSPSISPNGDKIAFISDRRGSQNIYIMSTVDGKILKTLVKGQRSESFEELHWLRPGISFSPDGRKITFAAKSGSHDAIFIVDVKSGKTKRHLLKELDGAFTTSWSPLGDKIAFVGNKEYKSDLYTVDLNTGEVSIITDDIFTEDHPSWSPDGKKLVFISDRKQYTDPSQIPENFRMTEFDYTSRDIYSVDIESHVIERITDTPWGEANPSFSPDGKTIAYTCDQNGIWNLYLHQLETGEDYPVTNVISGIYQISWDRNANKMSFTSFYHGGYDVYVLNNPLGLEAVELRDTQFITDMRAGDELPIYARNWKPKNENKKVVGEKETGDSPADYSKYVFSRYKLKGSSKQKKDSKNVQLPQNTYQDDNGKYKIRKYKLKFSPDIVTGSAGYNTFFGFSGYTTFAFSDLLGDHKIFLNVNLVSDLKNSDLNLLYLYLKRRITYGVGGYHLAYFFRSNGQNFKRYRNYGFNFLTAYPFSKFSRLEFGLNWYNIVLEHLTENRPDDKVTTVLPTLSYVHDSVLWGSIGPIDGTRYALSITNSPKYESDSREFTTLTFDFRRYFMINRDYNFAFRLSGGASYGSDPQRFFLGGVDNWINYKSADTGSGGVRGLRINDIGDVFFSSFITPLRGALYYQGEGSRFLLSNNEFRFPLIRFLGLGFPPVSFFNIQGAAFFDIGTAFYDTDNFRGTYIKENGNRAFRDIISGTGVGARIFFLYFLLRIDVAWQYDLDKFSQPVWYFSLGGDL